ncbi:alkaline shock response membrane anchor protein AmaP [bacterium]|nr:MAG: alkaline shock response membrane anchor protein AmaP [bacterium]
MRFFTVLVIFFYTVIFILISACFIAVALKVVQPQDIAALLTYLQESLNYRIIVGLCGILLLLISISSAQLILGRFQRERTIAFHTPSGQVTIALSAVEDLIKRLTNVIPEIRELRPDVIATKKGILVDLRVILRSEENIPEVTSRLQRITQAKIEEVLGIEGEIIIRIHVAKIISSEEKDKRKKDIIREEPTIPFGGYGRV